MTVISTTVGKNPLEEMDKPHSQQKSPKCSTWVQSQNHRITSVCFQDKPFNITVIQVYTPTTAAKEAEVEQSYDDPLELTLKKAVLFIIGN